MKFDEESGSDSYVWVYPKSDGTYTYVIFWTCFRCTSYHLHESGTWEINGDEITISDACGRRYTHPIRRDGDRIVIGQMEWKTGASTKNNYEQMLGMASESCIGDLANNNPQEL